MGFNGTERPGAVYITVALAGYTQKRLPAFSIYEKDVQNADDISIPNDVKYKILAFAKAGLAVAEMKGKSYLFISSVSMGKGGYDFGIYTCWYNPVSILRIQLPLLRVRLKN